MTSLPAETFEQACQVIEDYEYRWHIEEYHKVIKTGCKIEGHALRAIGRFEALIGLVSVIGVRLLQLKTIGKADKAAVANRRVPHAWLHALKRPQAANTDLGNHCLRVLPRDRKARRLPCSQKRWRARMADHLARLSKTATNCLWNRNRNATSTLKTWVKTRSRSPPALDVYRTMNLSRAVAAPRLTAQFNPNPGASAPGYAPIAAPRLREMLQTSPS